MTIRKRGDKYYVELWPVGRPGIYKTFRSKIEAQRWEAEQKILLKSPRSGDIIRRTVAEAFDRYSNEIAPTHKGERWENVRLEKFKRDVLADMYVDQVTFEDIEDWIFDRITKGLKNNSIRRELTLLSSVFRESVRWRYCTHNPIHDARKPKKGKNRVRRIADWEIEQTCHALNYKPDQPVLSCAQAGCAAWLLAIETAMRQGEIFKMLWVDIHLDRSYLEIPDSKNGDPRFVPLTERAKQIIEQMRWGHDAVRLFPFNQGSCGCKFREGVHKTAVVNMTFHDSRHEACSRMAMIDGMDAVKLAKITGHRDPRSVMIYFNPLADELVRLVQRGKRI